MVILYTFLIIEFRRLETGGSISQQKVKVEAVKNEKKELGLS